VADGCEATHVRRRPNARGRAVLGIVVTVVLLAGACAAGSADEGGAPTVESAALPEGDDHRIVRVVDGDTVEVDGDLTVRLIGVDTPETQHPSLGVQCYGREASAFTEQLLPEGTEVRLVTDVERLDRYDRTLAYVYRRGDGLFVNAELVRSGYAQVATFPPNVAHVEELLDAQRAARDAARGLWQACPDDATTSTAPPADATPDSASCDPSYPSTCIPPSPPDLDCDDLDARDIEVRPPDPHRLDGDGDGVGCAA
jgi:micrococcal nuclease